MNLEQEKRRPLDKLRTQDLKAIALYTLRNNLSFIADLTKVKAQTFRKKVGAVFKAGLWDELPSVLKESRVFFDEDGLTELYKQLQRDANWEPSFLRTGQTRRLYTKEDESAEFPANRDEPGSPDL